MIFCSNLPNDQDMIRALGSCAVPCSGLRTDAAFWGVGEGGSSIRVGVERKKTGDMAQCIGSGRYLHQAQAAKADGFDVLVLIAETGRIRGNPVDGLLEMLVWGNNPLTRRRSEIWKPVRPATTYSRWCQYLLELDYLAGIIVLRTHDVHETADTIRALHDNFQTPPSAHNSLCQIYEQPHQGVFLVKPGLVRRTAKELPGIGWRRSQDVAERFHSVLEMAEADEKTWREIPGVGKTTAKRVWESIRGLSSEEGK